MAGKSSPALFELIRDPNAPRGKGPISSRVDVPPGTPAGVPHSPGPSAEPPVTIPYYREPQPATRPSWEMQSTATEPAMEPPPEAQPVPQARRSGGQWGQPIQVPATVLGIAAAAVVLLLVVAFAAGYRSGFAKGDERATRELSLAAAPLTDPLRPENAGPVESRRDTGAGREAGPAGPSVTQPPRGQPSRETAPPPITTLPAIRAVMTPPEPDPRQAGLNYYAIVGQLDRESAQQIVTFLAENGVAALAVDTSPRGSNNPRSYRVYGLQGMTGPELRSPARPDYENRISQLGVIWKRDHRGWTDFSQTNWERYQP